MNESNNSGPQMQHSSPAQGEALDLSEPCPICLDSREIPNPNDPGNWGIELIGSWIDCPYCEARIETLDQVVDMPA